MRQPDDGLIYSADELLQLCGAGGFRDFEQRIEVPDVPSHHEMCPATAQHNNPRWIGDERAYSVSQGKPHGEIEAVARFWPIEGDKSECPLTFKMNEQALRCGSVHFLPHKRH
ncbi:hypothetical protein D3C71_1737780 [compost metagenome]